MVEKRLTSLSELQKTNLHKIRFGNIYLVLNKLIPQFAETVKDLDKRHPSLTVSSCNTDGFSILSPGTKVKQGKTNKVVEIEPGENSGLSYKTNFILKYRFLLSEKTMRNREEVIFKGRPTPSEISEINYKISYRKK